MPVTPKILLCAPTSRHKEYCRKEYITQIKSITYYNLERVLCDNSADRKYKQVIESSGIKCLYRAPHGRSNIVYVAESQEKLRHYAIQNEFDYMFWLETDVFTPYRTIIQLLLHHNKPVTSALYHILNKENSHLMIQQLSADDQFAVSYNLEGPFDSNFVDGSLKRVFHAGLGCCLVHKSVFSKIPFRYELGKASHSDTFFYHDLHKHNIPVYVDTSIICTHKNKDWNQLKIK